jgi:hypothetical protein
LEDGEDPFFFVVLGVGTGGFRLAPRLTWGFAVLGRLRYGGSRFFRSLLGIGGLGLSRQRQGDGLLGRRC